MLKENEKSISCQLKQNIVFKLVSLAVMYYKKASKYDGYLVVIKSVVINQTSFKHNHPCSGQRNIVKNCLHLHVHCLE